MIDDEERYRTTVKGLIYCLRSKLEEFYRVLETGGSTSDIERGLIREFRSIIHCEDGTGEYSRGTEASAHDAGNRGNINARPST